MCAQCKAVENMSTTTGEVMECISIEICVGKENVIVSCVYRAPGSKTFKNSMEGMFAKNNQKVTFICGDFNKPNTK